MKKLIQITLLLIFPMVGFSQQGIRFTDQYGPFHDAYQMENDYANRKVASYPFVSEANVLWRKVTWSLIDLREKQNLPLYYPIDTLHNRKSLINAIMDGIEKNQFNAFKTPLRSNAFEFDPNNIFTSINEIRDLGKREERILVEIRPGFSIDSLLTIRWRSDEITQFLIKEVWYFDKKDSRLRSEIIGICPIREYDFNGTMRRQRLFWIYYPDAREYFSTVPVYNPRNGRPLYSFDDLLVQRYFNSYFIQEENVYNDRLITDYVIGREAQLESQRIQKEIFNFELDLWEY
jgi:gliding motility associated protien GldN